MHNPACARCRELQQRIYALEAALGAPRIFVGLPRLRPQAALLARLLAARESASYEIMIAALWGGDAEGGPLDAERTISTLISHELRPWLAAIGVTLETLRGEGYRVKPDHLSRLRAVIADYDAGRR